jgi:hypothetical protein
MNFCIDLTGHYLSLKLLIIKLIYINKLNVLFILGLFKYTISSLGCITLNTGIISGHGLVCDTTPSYDGG